MKMLKKTTISATLLIATMVLMTFSPVMAAETSVATYIGHDFSEEYWAIEYDILSRELIKDYTPSELASQYQAPSSDPTPFIDANMYLAYMNLGQVQTFYAALTNFTRTGVFRNNFGTAPYQMLLQHFTLAKGQHVLVQNVFAGLIAYQNVGTDPLLPDKDDNLYYSYSLNSEYHKAKINDYLNFHISQTPFDENVLPKVTPKVLTRTEADGNVTYTFGMDYENLFVLWHPITEANNLNETDSVDVLFGKIVAISKLDYLNFTYVLSGKSTEKEMVQVSTTTEYDIGPISDLWILNDGQANTTNMGGQWWALPNSRSISHYSTEPAIEDRLKGNATILGFSLAVANFARIVVITARVEEDSKTGTVDQDSETIDPDSADAEVDKLELQAGGEKAYEIDFAGKPNYSLDGGAEQPAPAKLFPNVHVVEPTARNLDDMIMRFMKPAIKQLVERRIARYAQRNQISENDIKVDVEKRHAFYTICFPEWGGKSINQDPTFIAFSSPIDLWDARIRWIVIGATVIGGLGIAMYLVKKYRKK
jgi:hypothetical protein